MHCNPVPGRIFVIFGEEGRGVIRVENVAEAPRVLEEIVFLIGLDLRHDGLSHGLFRGVGQCPFIPNFWALFRKPDII
jgi:hypothetical protein